MARNKERYRNQWCVNCMVALLRPFTKRELKGFGRLLKNRKLDRIAKVFRGKLWNVRIKTKRGDIRRYLRVEDIDTPYKLAQTVRKQYGFGTWNVYFWNQYAKNKQFKKTFVCLGGSCSAYDRCRRKNVYKKGESCIKNRRFKANWTSKARIVITVLLILNYYFKKDKKSFGFAFVHNHKYSSLYQLIKWKPNSTLAKLYKPSNFVFIFILIFLTLSLFSVTQNTFFYQIPTSFTEQQITPTGDFILAVEPASFSETIWDLAFLFFVWSLILWLFSNFFPDSPTSRIIYWVVMYTVFPLTQFFWRIANHIVRYKSIETSLFNVGLGGFIMAIFVVFFGSIFIYYIAHFLNNLLFKATKLWADERIILATIIIIIIYVGLFVLFKLFTAKISKKIKPTLPYPDT